MTDLLSNIKNEVGIFCLLKGTKIAAECLKIEAKDVKKFLSRCDFDGIEFFSKLSEILETTIEELGLEDVAANLSVSKNLIKLIAKGSGNRIDIYQEFQKIVKDELSSRLDKETQFPIENKKNEPKESNLFEEEFKKKRSRPKSSRSVASNSEKQPIKRPKITEINKSTTPPPQNNMMDISMPILNPPMEAQNLINPAIIYSEPQFNTGQTEIISPNNSAQNQAMSAPQIPNIFSPQSMMYMPFLSKYGQFGYPQPSYPTNSDQNQNIINYTAYTPNDIMTLSSQLMAGTIPIQGPVQRPNPPNQSSSTRNTNQNPRQTQATCTSLLLKYNIPYHTPPNGNILDPDYSYRPSNIN